MSWGKWEMFAQERKPLGYTVTRVFIMSQKGRQAFSLLLLLNLETARQTMQITSIQNLGRGYPDEQID